MNEWEQLISDLKAKRRALRFEIDAKTNQDVGLEIAIYAVEEAYERQKKEAAGQ